MAAKDDWGWSEHITFNRCVAVPEDHYGIVGVGAVDAIAEQLFDAFSPAKAAPR